MFWAEVFWFQQREHRYEVKKERPEEHSLLQNVPKMDASSFMHPRPLNFGIIFTGITEWCCLLSQTTTIAIWAGARDKLQVLT